MTTSLFQVVFAQRDDSREQAAPPRAGRTSWANDEVHVPSIHSAHDAEQLRQIQRGSTAAFESLFAQHWEPLWRFARALTHSSDVAEDIVQGVFTRVWVLRASWHPQGSIQAYLFRAVRNAFMDRQKHHRVMRGYADTEFYRWTEAATAELQAERNDQQSRLDTALAQLPDVRRQGVLLRYEHGLSYAEIGTVLGMSAGAAEKQIARTIETLRQRVAE